jgi:hypothetical protein
MFCPNCGEKLESQNQKFCASCGSVLSYTPDVPQLRAEENQASSPVKPIPVYESKPIKTGGPGPHSKKCFAFAFVSIALAIVSFFFGGFYFMVFNSFRNSLLRIYLQIILSITGLIFGIRSLVHSNEARFEPTNTLKQFGSVVAGFGIIMNAITLITYVFALISLMRYVLMCY